MLITSETVSFLEDAEIVLLSNLVMTTARVMRGSATESRSRPDTVTTVPPLYTCTGRIFCSSTYEDGLLNLL